jgi:hypothetical protein
VGDCAIKRAGARLKFEVPETLHDLSVEDAKVSAPRVLQAVEGDFEAGVMVIGKLEPAGDRTSTCVAAVNTSTAPLVAEFKEFKIEQPAN